MEKPIRWNLFVEDRLDLGDVVVVGGLRYDCVSTPGPAGPADFPVISSQPVDFDPNDPDAFFANDSLFPEDESHNYLSPHVQVSFPVTERTNFRLSYAHQVQAPDFGLILQGINTDRSITNTEPVLRHRSRLRAHDHRSSSGSATPSATTWCWTSRPTTRTTCRTPRAAPLDVPDPLSGSPMESLRFMTNVDFGNTRGIDVRLDRRIGRLFNGTLAYTFQDSKNTGSDPDTYLDFGSRVINAVVRRPAAAAAGDPAHRLQPAAHPGSGAASLTFPEDWEQGTAIGLDPAQRRASSSPSASPAARPTPAAPRMRATRTSSRATTAIASSRDPLNSSRLPAFKQLDARFTKGFALGRLDLTAYVEARNLLNFRNVIQVFTTNSNITNAVEEGQNWAADSADLSTEAALGPLGRAGQDDGAIDLTSAGPGPPAAVTGSTRRALPRRPTASLSSGRRSASATATGSSIWRSSAGPRMRCTTPCAEPTPSPAFPEGCGSGSKSTSRPTGRVGGRGSANPWSDHAFSRERLQCTASCV